MLAALRELNPAKLADADKNLIRTLWDRLSGFPGGKLLFSKAVGMAAPYTGSIGAVVEELEQGRAVVAMRDRPHLRNHLRSVHAVALANLAELTGNVAFVYSLPDDARFIVRGMSLDYVKKARGTIRGIGTCPRVDSADPQEYKVHVRLVDESGDTVATAELLSRVGPKPSR